jgi:flagellar basal-body rod modification protein FlgD
MSTSAALTTAPTGPITTYNPTPSSSGNAYGAVSPTSGTLTQNDFLNLLVTQLQNQDPTDPESDTDMASQMAQFTSLTDMSDMNTTMSGMSDMQQLSSGASMIGQTVTTDLTTPAGAPLTGPVTSVSIQNGALTLQVGGQSVSLSDITGVMPTKTAS